uniref:Uncharacterized protein n=1 Tax=Knipowitschia caucasica TaxID=637954 RepID=A0AAV2IXB2_KNICA
MVLLGNHTETLDQVEPSSHWESTSLVSAAAVDAIVMLGVLTFALQLCLVLYFLFRCWRLDSRVKESLKLHHKSQFDTLFHLNIITSKDQPLRESTANSSPPSTDSHHLYEPADGAGHLFMPSIPWDLVQH